MTELLLGVLKGHLALGGHALLMSATLGAAARSKFTNRGVRFSPPVPKAAENVPYPTLHARVGRWFPGDTRDHDERPGESGLDERRLDSR